MRPERPKIALLGFMLETNGFAPVADEAEFKEKLWLEGDGLLADVRGPASRDVESQVTIGSGVYGQALDGNGTPLANLPIATFGPRGQSDPLLSATFMVRCSSMSRIAPCARDYPL